MHITIEWIDVCDNTATANLVDANGVYIRKWNITNVQEFLDEYYKYKTRPEPPSPYWTRDSHIATLTYYLDRIEEAMKEIDDAVKLAKVKEILVELNTPVAIA